MNDSSLAPGARLFNVRFGPPDPPSGNEAWPNNLQLAGSGTVEVTADSVKFTDFRSASLDKHRTFAMHDIANIGYGVAEDVIVLRTRNDDREVYFWPATREDTRALLALLPTTTTPTFVENQTRQQKFHATMGALAPKALVTPTIVGLNVAMFLVMLLAGAGLMGDHPEVHLRFGSDYGPLTWGGEPWRLIVSAFIHFGVIHLAFNMYALYNGGMLTERLYGSARFAVIYLLSALSGSVVSDWWNATRNSAGASGAIFGVYGALLVFFALRRADIPPSLFKTAGRGAITLCVYSLGMGAALPFVNNAAHVGGLLGGAAAGFLLVRPFEPTARTIAQPWKLVAVSAGICAALALLAAPLMSPTSARTLELRYLREVREFSVEDWKLIARTLGSSHRRVTGGPGDRTRRFPRCQATRGPQAPCAGAPVGQEEKS